MGASRRELKHDRLVTTLLDLVPQILDLTSASLADGDGVSFLLLACSLVELIQQLVHYVLGSVVHGRTGDVPVEDLDRAIAAAERPFGGRLRIFLLETAFGMNDPTRRSTRADPLLTLMRNGPALAIA
jgi:hypothetical protein